MLSKESKIRVLENFYALDYVFFGKPLKKVDSCCPLIKEDYLSIKGALLSVFIEMAKMVEHSPKKLDKRMSSKSLLENSKVYAKEAREAASHVVKTVRARNDIKTELKLTLKENKDYDIPTLIEEKIREKAFRLAIDNILVARLLGEAKKVNALNDWTGKIVEDSYKILRDNLCETANLILHSDE
jgi:spore coat polysaccharide biosynthesis protein SpsF (cytidylyltransferase family)